MFCWGKPDNSKSFHVFHESRSLCGSWFYGGADEAVADGVIEARAGDCKGCVKRLNAHRKPTAARKTGARRSSRVKTDGVGVQILPVQAP